jgi:hypothetical protein
MDGDPLAGDAFENTIVGRGLAPNIVLGLQTVDGDYDIDVLQRSPGWRDLTECAGDNLYVNTTLNKLRHEYFQLAVSYERITSDDRQLERPHAIDHLQHTVNKSFAFEVGQIA